MAFLMWCNRKFETKSPTEVECYWKKSALSNIGVTKKFMTSDELVGKSTKRIKLNVGPTFLTKLIEQSKTNDIDSQLSRHMFDYFDGKVNSLSIHDLLYKFLQEHQGQNNCESFLRYAETKMSDNLCKMVENCTKDQKDNPLWHELRYGRITASNIYEASKCKTENGNLVNRILGAVKVYDNIYMKRGRNLEGLVLDKIKSTLKIEINDCGLFLFPSVPIFGASPDGIGDDFIVEIKCPSSEKTMRNYLSNGKISNKCRGQLNLQMLATGKKKGLFCVADPDFEKNSEIKHMWVDYDEKFATEMITNAKQFWIKNVYPLLLNVFTRE